MAEQLELAYAGMVSFGHRPFLTEVASSSRGGRMWRSSAPHSTSPPPTAPVPEFGPRAIRATAYEPGTYHMGLGLGIFDGLEVVDFGDAHCPHGQTEFFDGNCGMCTRSRNLLLRLDRTDALRTEPLQADGAAVSAAIGTRLALLVYRFPGTTPYCESNSVGC